jgi:TonB-linked SusC/RagA family outer membrane protein
MRILRCANLFPKRGERVHIGKIIPLVAWLVIFTLPLQAKVRSQELVSLSFKNGSLENVLKEIRRQTGYLYALQDQWKDKARPIDINIDHTPLDEALGMIFKSQPFSYTIIGKTIVIKEKEVTATANITPPIHVKGIIYNEAAQPLAGANIMIKETEKGTITNASGEFELSSAPANSTLIISFVGYAPAQVKVKEGSILKVYLKEAKNQLDKVVVQAYGTTTQRLATGNIGTVTAEDIAKQPVMNVLDVIQGQVPGAVVTNSSGYASGQVKVEIRGRNTINTAFPSDPLYIIDGVPLSIQDAAGSSNYANGSPGFLQSQIGNGAGSLQSPFFNINPSDIESIEVLKDADATAIYGSRGANGVILVTTKKGKAGKTRFNLDVTQGEETILRTFPMLNTRQYVAMREEALANDGLPININTAPDLVVGDSNRYTNWEKYLWGGRIGTYTDGQMSLTGGDDQTTFRIATGYHSQKDLTAASGGNSRGSLSLNLNHKAFDQRFSIGVSANYSYAASNQIYEPNAPNLPPDAPPVFDKSGNLDWTDWDAYYASPGANPFYGLLQPYYSGVGFLNSNLTLSYEILKGLVIQANTGYNNAQGKEKQFTPIASQDPSSYNPTASVQYGTSLIHNIIFEPQVEYNTFLGKGKFNALAGVTDQVSSSTGVYEGGVGITNDILINNLGSVPEGSRFYGYNEVDYKYAGIYGRVNYNWRNKYILNLNARRDGSSRFGPGREYGNFGSVGLAWIFSEEDWVKNHFNFISFGKIRASYGTTGSDNIGNYEYLTQWSFGNYQYNGYTPLTPLRHTDSLYQWQVNKKFEAALDLTFLKDRISVSSVYYLNRCNNQLVPFPTPGFTGFASVLTNDPADVQNSGFEFIANVKIVDSRNFRFSTRFNIGINRNKLVSYPNISQSPYASTLVVGKPLNIIFRLYNTGVDPQTGLYTFEDKNKDGQITYNYNDHQTDDSYIYNLSPKFDGGLTLTFGYREWELSGLFYFREQYGTNAFASLDPPGDGTNQPVEVLKDHWQKPGDVAKYARFTTTASDVSYQNFYNSDGTVTNASFIRLQNLSLSYSLFKSNLPKGIGSLRINIRSQNLFVLTKYKGPDPETQSFTSLPLPRNITGGISIGF